MLDVVARRGAVGEAQQSGEAIQAVADGYINSLAEDAVAPLTVGQHLCVASRYVKDDGVAAVRYDAAHLNMSDAMIDSNERLLPQQG